MSPPTSVGVHVDGGVLRAFVDRPGDPGDPLVLDAGGALPDRVAFGHVARWCADRFGVADDVPWCLAVSSQLGSPARRQLLASARGACRAPIGIVASSQALAAGLDPTPRRAAVLWWGRGGVDVAVVRDGVVAGHGGGAAPSCDDLLVELGEDEVGADAPRADRRAAGAWLAQQPETSGAVDRVDAARRWADPLRRVLDLVDEATEAALGAVEPAEVVAGGPPLLLEALASADPGHLHPVRTVADHAIASGAARLAMGTGDRPPLLGYDIGLQSRDASGPVTRVVVARNTPLPVRRSMVLGAIQEPADHHRAFLYGGSAPEVSMNEDLLEVTAPADPAIDRYRLVVDVDGNGIVTARLEPLG